MQYLIVVMLLIGLDQAVKYWALTSLQAQQTIPLLDGVFHLTYVENRGAAFSMFAQFDSRWIFVTLAVVITIAIAVVLRKGLMQHALGCWSLVMVAAGALGNAIDRVFHGFVVDLFDFRLIHFPVFNVADIFICVGGILFVIYYMFMHKDVTPTKPMGDIEEHEDDA